MFITSNSAFASENDYNRIYTSKYTDTVVAKNGKFDIWTTGNKGKKITTGDYKDLVHIGNNGKNTINLGNGENLVTITNLKDMSNAVTTGIDKDRYDIAGGNNKITDKGGNNTFNIDTSDSNNTITALTGDDTYTISKGINSITDKGGTNSYTVSGSTNNTIKTSGDNTFKITLHSGSKANITANKGSNTLNIYNYGSTDYTNQLTANLGDGVNTVNINSDNITPGNTVDANIITGKSADIIAVNSGKSNTINSGAGDDTFDIKGGLKNTIKSGNGIDTLTVSGGTNTIYAGNADDIITITGGNNTVYGESGCDEITISNGENIIYGGGDNITATGGQNKIYAKGDTVNLSGGGSEVFTACGNNMIYATANGITEYEINLTKGNNTVSVSGENTNAKVTVTTGKNTINTNGTASTSIDASKAKTAQYLNIEGSSFISGQLGKGNDTIILKSDANDPNVLKSGDGNDKFYIFAGKKTVYGEKGNDYFEITGGESHSVYGDDGNDKFLIQNYKTKYCTVSGGAGNDTFNAEGGTEVTMNGGEGNDTFNIKQGIKNVYHGGEGNDTFNITGEDATEATIWGDKGDNTVNVNGGNGSKIYGGSGKGTFNIIAGTVADLGGAEEGAVYNMKGGNVTKTQAGSAVDTFNITGGNHGAIKAGNGDDVFNIKGGTISLIKGEEGQDIYNLYNHDGLLCITDSLDNNTYNVKKGYYSALIATNGSHENAHTEDSFVFDKSFKLTNDKNVGAGNELKTNKSSVSVFFNYDKNATDNGDVIYFAMDLKDEILDGEIDDHYICATPYYIDGCTIDGKKYTLNLDTIKAHVSAWFGEHTGYTSSNQVLSSNNEADINSLMAIYVKDTQSCFVKA